MGTLNGPTQLTVAHPCTARPLPKVRPYPAASKWTRTWYLIAVAYPHCEAVGTLALVLCLLRCAGSQVLITTRERALHDSSTSSQILAASRALPQPTRKGRRFVLSFLVSLLVRYVYSSSLRGIPALVTRTEHSTFTYVYC